MNGERTSTEAVEAIVAEIVRFADALRDRIDGDPSCVDPPMIRSAIDFAHCVGMVREYMVQQGYAAAADEIEGAVVRFGVSLDRVILANAYAMNRGLSEQIKGLLADATATTEQRDTLDKGMSLLIQTSEEAARRAMEAGHVDYAEKFLELIGRDSTDPFR